MSLILAFFLNAIVLFALMEFFSARFSSLIRFLSVYFLVALIHLHLFAGFVVPESDWKLAAVPVSVLCLVIVMFGGTNLPRALVVALLYHVAILGTHRLIAAAQQAWPWLIVS